MGHRLDLIDLEAAQSRLPAVSLEQWIMIGTQMPRGAPPTNGVVEHAVEAGAIDGPAPPGDGRECVDKTRYTTFLSMSTPNVREMMRAMRGQPNRGLRDLSSTMAWMSASLGPFGPGFFGHWLDENSRRYLRRTNA